jgi:hypothetical protein
MASASAIAAVYCGETVLPTGSSADGHNKRHCGQWRTENLGKTRANF